MTEPRADATLDPIPAAEPEVPVAGPVPAAPPAAAPAAADDAPPVVPPPANGADASLLALVDRLSTILERSDLLELEVEAGGTGLRLRKSEALAPVAPAGSAAPAAGTAPAGGGSREASEASVRPSVKAPLTGIWYSAPAPGTAPFVEVGREVAVGQVIGLIEAMKLFNEIKSDLGGRVVKVMADNGQLVKARQPLIEVEPL